MKNIFMKLKIWYWKKFRPQKYKHHIYLTSPQGTVDGGDIFIAMMALKAARNLNFKPKSTRELLIIHVKKMLKKLENGEFDI